MIRKKFTNVEDACALAHAIVDTVREPVVVLDQDLRVIAASRSFYQTFNVNPDDTEGTLLYELGDRQWNISKLRLLLEKIIPEHGVMEGYEVEHDFAGLGKRMMRLNARQVFYEAGEAPVACTRIPHCAAASLFLSRQQANFARSGQGRTSKLTAELSC
jgi:PAS domain-containing protein